MELIALRDAAKDLGVLPDTLRQAIAQGRLIAVKRNESRRSGAWYITRQEVERYRAQRLRPRNNKGLPREGAGRPRQRA